MCFTYATWFGCAALAALGHSCANDDALARASTFLVSKQREDGGWGESYLSCQDKVRGPGGPAGKGHCVAGSIWVGPDISSTCSWCGVQNCNKCVYEFHGEHTSHGRTARVFETSVFQLHVCHQWMLPLAGTGYIVGSFGYLQVYSQLEGESHVVNTAWAMMALLSSGYHLRDEKPLHRAARFLMNMQEPSGDWPQQHISGVFNRNCMITYANYR